MLCELGNPFKKNQRVSVPPTSYPTPPNLSKPGLGSLGGGSSWLLHGPRVLQVELLITFEVNNMALDTREVLVWLDLST